MMYNMAKDKEYYDLEFFKKLDNHLNIKLIDNDDFEGYFAYGALYAYYNFGIGKPENVIFFERYLAAAPAKLSNYFYFLHVQDLKMDIIFLKVSH